MDSSLVALGTIAASGTAVVTVPYPQTLIENLEISVSASYAAQAAVSGLTFQFQSSPDNVTFTAIGDPVAVTPQAGALLASTSGFVDANIPQSDSEVAGPVAYVKVTMTNTDTVNVVSYAIQTEGHK